MNTCRKFAAALALVAVSTACSARADETSFSQDMLERARKVFPGADLLLKTDEPLVIQIRKGSVRDEGVINLHRIWSYCQNVSPADCEASKVEFLSKISFIPPPAHADTLRLIVRDREYYEYIRDQPAVNGDRLGVGRPIGGGLYALLASDSKDALAMVGDKALKEMGLTEQQAWDVAFRQTKAKLPALPPPAKLKKAGYAYQDSEYLGSLLADLPAWERISREVGPNLFVTVVSDQMVFVGTMPPGPGLESFKQTVAEDCKQQQRCISPYIYRFYQGEWKIAP
jgi:hypothetical protein